MNNSHTTGQQIARAVPANATEDAHGQLDDILSKMSQTIGSLESSMCRLHSEFHVPTETKAESKVPLGVAPEALAVTIAAKLGLVRRMAMRLEDLTVQIGRVA